MVSRYIGVVKNKNDGKANTVHQSLFLVHSVFMEFALKTLRNRTGSGRTERA